MKSDLQDIAISIFKVCMKNSITLELEWVPRSENETADYLSRIVDYDDWGISFKTMDIIIQRFENLQVDWFASEHNAKLSVFYSRFWNPSSTGMDAFSESWHGKFGLFVPPVSIIYRVIRKLEVDQVQGVLVVPFWKSAVFWPLLCPNGRFISNIVDMIDLPGERSFYVKCKNGRGIFGNTDLHFRMLALMINFKGEWS